MSWPLLLTTIGSSLIGVVDLQVAGFLGSAQQAAVGVAEQIIFLFMIFIMSLGVGTTALVSRATGGGNHQEALEATAQSIVFAAAMGLALLLGSLCFSHSVLALFTSSAAVRDLGTQYLHIYSFYLIPFSMVAIINAAFRAIGDAKTPLLVVIFSTTVTIAGDYATVLGNWPVADLGIQGIAASGVAGSAVACCIALLRLWKSNLGPSIGMLLPVNAAMIKRLLSVAIPSAFQRVGWAMSVFVVFFILARCQNPTHCLAAWTIGMRVEGMIFMPLMAFSLAVSSIVGQNLGARQFDRAFQAGWQVTWIGIWLMLVCGALLFFSADNLSRFMSHDPQTIEYTTNYIKINALAEPFLALGMVLSGALQGAGETRSPMWISLFTNWAVRLPLAWVLSLNLGLGPSGVWIAMTVSVIIMGILMAWRFQSRKWLAQHV